MADTKISNLNALAEAPSTADLLAIVDVTASETKKLTIANLIDAVEANANTFTAAQTIDLSTDVIGLIVDVSASPTADALRLDKGGTAMIRFDLDTQPKLQLQPYDNGAGLGPLLTIRENNNASTPAAGALALYDKGSTLFYMWTDDSGNLRIGTSAPINANDTSGTVVGTQTSWHELKEEITEWDGAEALAAIQALTLYSYRMIEDGQKTPEGAKPTYYGLVITEEDRANNAWFSLGLAENQVPVLNDRTIFGYLLAAVRHGANIIGELQARVTALEAA